MTSISGCRVTSVADWVTCITVAMEEKSTGYCMPLEVVHQQDVSTKSKHTFNKLFEYYNSCSSKDLLLSRVLQFDLQL